jgi:hypothetical protein
MLETKQAKKTVVNTDVSEVKAETGDAGKGKSHVGQPLETGGPTGPEPTRYGDWERKGRCIDF